MRIKIERINVSAIVHSTESQDKVAEAMSILFPFEFEILVSKAKGHYGNEMAFLEVELKRKEEISKFWNYLIELLGEQKYQILEMLDNLLDDSGVLHLRIDKQKAYLKSVYLASGGDTIVLKAKIVTYPLKKEKLKEAVKKLIEDGY